MQGPIPNPEAPPNDNHLQMKIQVPPKESQWENKLLIRMNAKDMLMPVEPEEDIGFLAAGITGSCKPL
ncbi:hypothetical protein STEG23_033130 [Scotinomys teguina]